MELTKEAALERIVNLETVGVGCGPDCLCRVHVAISLTDEQAVLLDAEAKAVVSEKKPPVGEEGIIALFGPSATEGQVFGLKRIAEDKRLPGRNPDKKGGVQGAEWSLAMYAMAQSPTIQMLAALFGGPDIAEMSDDDIRRGAYAPRGT